MKRTKAIWPILAITLSIDCRGHKPPTEDVISVDPKPLAKRPIPLPGPDPRRQRLMAYLDFSGMEMKPGKSDAEKPFRETLGPNTSVFNVATPVKCHPAGCFADVAYANIEALMLTDKKKFRNPEAPIKWYGSYGRTAPRLEGRHLVATWYFLMPPDDDLLKRMRTKGAKFQ